MPPHLQACPTDEAGTTIPTGRRHDVPNDRLRTHLRARLGEQRFERWLSSASLDVGPETVSILAEDEFSARWIDRHLSADLRRAITDALGNDVQLDVRVAETVRHGRDMAEAPAPERRPAREVSSPLRQRAARLRSLDDFVLGESNRLAHAAATGLLDVPKGVKCGPVFIHGDCGVGKTHVLQGVCRLAMERTGFRRRVLYVTAEQFTNEYIQAVRDHGLERFRARYRGLDLLAIDDIHFLTSKVRTQNELLHTLDAIDLGGARVLLASDAHPSAIRRFHRGLVSRFVSGTVVRIEPPDHHTRRTLVERMMHQRGLPITDEARSMLAASCAGSVRDLEGLVNRLSALQLLRTEAKGSRPIDRHVIERVKSDADRSARRAIRPADVIDAVTEHLGVTRQDLFGSGRHRKVVLARALAAWLMRHLTTMSLPEIARSLGREAHSTIHTAIRRLDQQMAEGTRVEVDAGRAPTTAHELMLHVRESIRAKLAEGAP